jgi:hypothetical protein
MCPGERHTAVRAVALTNMLKPSGLQNCEDDDDRLIDSVLQKSSDALRGLRANAKRTSAVTMRALETVIGAGFRDEDWASEGEEVAEDDAVKVSLTPSELQIVDALGGYVVTRLSYKKKLPCDGCRTDLLSSEQSIILQERQLDGEQLLSASPSLKTFLLTAETLFRRLVAAESFCVEEQLGLKLKHRILAEVSDLECCHPNSAAEAILSLFLRVRLHHHCRLRNAHISSDKQQKTKDRKMKKLL